MGYYKPISTISSVSVPATPIPVTISSATAPTTKPNGGDLVQGDIWYDTTTSNSYLWIVTDGVGNWLLLSAAAAFTFTGGFVPNTITVGGTNAAPELTLSSTGDVTASGSLSSYQTNNTDISFATYQNDVLTSKVSADGGIQIGGSIATGGTPAVTLGPTAQIEFNNDTLSVSNGKLMLNGALILTEVTTADVTLTHPVNNGTLFAFATVPITLTALPPIGTLTTQEDYNVWNFSAIEYLEEFKVGEAPTDGQTYGRVGSTKSWTAITGLSLKGSVPTVADLDNIPNPQNGDMYVVEASGDGYVYNNGVWTDVGPIRGPEGPAGPTGPAATISVGSTNTGAAGTDAVVTNSGSNSAAIFDFIIPQGATGPTGPTGDTGADGSKGDTGTAATVAVGTTTTGNAGTNATVTNSGTTGAAVLEFTIPQGIQGAAGNDGSAGAKGDTGTAATATAGTTSTLAAGQSATVTNAGTTSAAVFDFGIPQGAKGDTGTAGSDGSQGNPGAAATIAVGTTTTGNPGTDAAVTNTGSSSAATFDFTIPRGAQGAAGNDGSAGAAATINVGTTTTGDAGTDAIVTNSGSSSAATFNFTIPQGIQGVQGVAGTDGTSVNLTGSVAEVGDLPTTAPVGTLYVVLANGDGYVSDGEEPTSTWTDVGPIRGPAGPIGGTNTQVVYNDNGVANGNSGLTWSGTTLTATNIDSSGTVDAGFLKGDGSQITNLTLPSTFTFKGSVLVSDAAPGSPSAGDYYLNSATATAAGTWTGIAGNQISTEQIVYYTAGNEWVAGGVQDTSIYLAKSGGTMSGTLVFAGGQTTATTGAANIVQLSSSTSSTSETLAATPKAVKTVQDAVTSVTSDLVTTDAQVALSVTDIATNASAISVNAGNISTNASNIATNTAEIASGCATANAALPKGGGTMTGVIIFDGSQTFPGTITSIPTASVSQAGIVQLNNATDSTSETLAATSLGLKNAYDQGTTGINNAAAAQATANAALPKSGGTMSGDITFNSGQTFPGTVTSIPTASLSQAGIVQLNSSVTSTSESQAGTANAVKDAYDRGSLGVTNAASAQVTADASLPKGGGTMTGQIVFVNDQIWPTGSGSVTSVNTKTGAVVLTASDVSALPTAGGTMTGNITFNSGQTFPGAGLVDSVNGETGTVVLTASDVSALPIAGGTLTGSIKSNRASADDIALETQTGGTTKGQLLADSTLRIGITSTTEEQLKILPTGSIELDGLPGTTGQVLTSAGTDNTPTWSNNVSSVNGETGIVTLDANEVGALPITGGTLNGGLNGTTINASGTITANLFSGTLPYSDLTGTPTIPTNNNQLTNGANYITISSVPTNNNQLTNGSGYYKSGDSPSFATVTAESFVGGVATVTTAPPATPEIGQLWYNTDNGIMYVWYQDGDQTGSEGQWVDIRPGGEGVRNDTYIATALTSVKAAANDPSTDLAGMKAAIVSALASF